MEFNIKVRRYDPSTDGQSNMQAYTLDIEEDATVLDALMRIREEQDSTLAFRGTCRSGFCGDCTMRISRRNRIACCTSVSQALRDDEITIEPIRIINVAKDMMFDMGAMVYDKYKAVEPWIEPSEPLPQREHMVPNEVIQDPAEGHELYHVLALRRGMHYHGSGPQIRGPSRLDQGVPHCRRPPGQPDR